jgi:AcrR family transcriptional regulator
MIARSSSGRSVFGTVCPAMSTPPLRPALRERYDQRRRAVVDAAARTFAERGYHGTSVNDLIEATGLTSGGLYHYIGSKEQLLLLVLDELMEPLLAEAHALLADATVPAEEQLRRLLRVWLAHVEGHRDHMLVFQQERHVIEHQPRWREVRARRKDFEQLLDGVLARLEAEGVLRTGDRRLALLALLGMVNHTPQWFDPAGRLGPAEIADGYCDILLARAAQVKTTRRQT